MPQLPKPQIALRKMTAPAVIVLKRATTSTSRIRCYWCEETKEADDKQLGFCCPKCTSDRMRIPGLELTPKHQGDWRNWLPEELLTLQDKADALDGGALVTLAKLRNTLPPEAWPKRPKKREVEIEFTEPRKLKLEKPACALPKPPPPPPAPVFRRLAIVAKKPAPAVPLRDAVFIRKLTVNGAPKKPLAFKKMTPTPAPKTTPAPVAGKPRLSFVRRGEADI